MAKLMIKARDVDGTGGTSQHMYWVYEDDSGQEWALSGFPQKQGFISLLKDDLHVEYKEWDKSRDRYKPGDTPHITRDVFQGSDAQVQAKLDLMIDEANRINSEGYDYNLPLTDAVAGTVPEFDIGSKTSVLSKVSSAFANMTIDLAVGSATDFFGGNDDQNSNTVAMALAKSAGLEQAVNSFITTNNLHVPGSNATLEHTSSEKLFDIWFGDNTSHPLKIVENSNNIQNLSNTNQSDINAHLNTQSQTKINVANALVTEAILGASDTVYSTISDRLGNGYLVTDGAAVKIGDGAGQVSQADADAEIARRIAERDANSGGGEGGGSEGGGSGGGGGGGGGGDGNGKPVVLDLDGDGVELVRLNDSPAYYDIFDDDYYYQMGWVSADDGFLAFDIGRDGVIEAHNELSFVSYVEGAQTDLQGLAYFDSNNDGLLDSNDAQWDQFGIWQDKDQDAITDWDEYNTLTNLDIASISLTSDGQQTTLAGNQVFGFGTYTTTSGQQKALADVGLSVGNGVQLDTYEGFTIKGQSGHQYWFDEQNQTSTTVASDTRYQGYFTQDGNDTLIIGHAQDVMVDGGTGDDTLTGGDGDDIIMGSAGSDTLAGGAGNDVLLWDENDKNINGNAGYDTALFTGSDTANLQVNMHSQSLETVYTKGGDDTITAVGKTERVYIEAAAGNDTITGGLGNDTLSGGEGRDQLIGGAGDDILHGGMHADWLDAGAGDDHLYFDAFDTMVLGGEGTDTGYFDAQGQENTSINLTKSSLEVLYGDTSSDLVTAHLKTEAILVYANDGADIILGGLGDDIIHGEAGTDVLNGGAGADQLTGGDGNDQITFDSADILVDGGTGYDTGILQSASGETVTVNLHDLNLERVFSQAGNDTLNASELQQAANLQAGAGADTLTGSQHNDLLRGDDGNDVLTGGLGSDQLQGGQGNDTLYFDISDSLVDGGEGIDIGHLNANNEQHINFDLTKASVEILYSDTSGDLLTAFNHTQAVTIYANDGADYVEGSDHDDQLFGEAGHDTLKGGAGADKLDGGAGNDTLYFDQQDTQVQGGEGYDVGFMQSQANTVASIDLQKTSLERLIAGDANDLITARDKNQAVIASGGNGQDYLEGTKHDDVLNGDAGHDTLKGGAGADTLNGGAGYDEIHFDRWDEVQGGDGFDTGYLINDDAGATMVDLYLSELERLFGSDRGEVISAYAKQEAVHIHAQGGTDYVDGGKGDDWMYGGNGHDTLAGKQGNDHMYGGQGRDFVKGDQGDDHLYGNAGDDWLSGGSGNDTYHWNWGDGNDVIRDFDNQDASNSLHLDVLQFGDDIDLSHLSFERQGDDLQIHLQNQQLEQQTLTIDSWYEGEAHQLQQMLLADDTEIDTYRVLG